MGFIDYKAASKAKEKFANKKPYLEPGIDFELAVQLAKAINGHKGKSFVFEFKVLGAKAMAAGVVLPPVGAERAYVIKFTGAPDDPGMGKLNTICQAFEGGPMPGLSQEQLAALEAAGKSTTEIEEANGEAQGNSMEALLANVEGFKIRATTNGTTTSKGNPFTVINWHYVPGQTLEEAKARALKMKNGDL